MMAQTWVLTIFYDQFEKRFIFESMGNVVMHTTQITHFTTCDLVKYCLE